MAETQRQNCKFFLLRYVPDALKNEFVNIGLVLLPPHAPAELRLAKDWSRVRALDPQADLEMLDAFGHELQLQMGAEETRDVVLKKIEDWFSNSLQATEYKGCLTDSPAQEADELARIYLNASRRRASREKGPRQMIFRRIKKEFELAGVWRAMRKDIPASQYTRSGDPLKIDCGYGVNSTIKMFHATPLRSEINAAKALAFTFPQLVEGLRRAEGAQAQLTAIVEDGLQRENEAIVFAMEVLQGQNIKIASLADLPQIAELAAREIRAT